MLRKSDPVTDAVDTSAEVIKGVADVIFNILDPSPTPSKPTIEDIIKDIVKDQK